MDFSVDRTNPDEKNRKMGTVVSNENKTAIVMDFVVSVNGNFMEKHVLVNGIQGMGIVQNGANNKDNGKTILNEN